MLYPPMTIRPDEIIRSGIVQPFGVRQTSPVTFARHEIDPFINAIRPAGPQANVVMDGALGAISAQSVPGLGAVTADRAALLGLVRAHNMPLAAGETGMTEKLMYGLGGIVLGALGGYFLSKML